jgi:DNA-binding Xre family transcriptional regulator
MASQVDYEWRLRPLMARQGIYTAAELAPHLAEHGVRLSASQVWRLVTGKPERLNLHTLMVLCQILECTPNDLIERIEVQQSPSLSKRAAVGERAVSDIDPKPARIRGARKPPGS